MKWLDEVRVTSDKYEKEGVKKGAVGTIMFSEIRNYCWEVHFSNKDGSNYAEIEVNVADLELVRDIGLTDEEILNDLPRNDPNWWCKVEDGYILNLKGERKNKIPYDYES
ncbi:MAG: hypothetical protein IJA69_04035 [Clostridia bacterium]|nr:hypothetical protein [Clostridia bacterium]